MIIGFDAKRLFHNHTGLGVYSRLLVGGLRNSYPDEQWILFAKNAKKSAYWPDFQQFRIKGSSAPLWRSWRICDQIRDEQCDIYHGLSHELPTGIEKVNVRTVVTIHDVIFKVDPQLYSWVDRQIYDFKWRHSCNTADVIVVVSRHTGEDLIRYYGVDETKIRVIGPPVELPENGPDPGVVRKQYALPKEFFLYVGSLSKRKNVLSILKAMRAIRPDIRVPLVIIGTGREQKFLESYCKQHSLDNRIVFLGHISREHLAVIYRLAHALIYPSYYEGFGLPVVEALRSRTPVITSNTSSLPEAAGPGGILVDPASPGQLAEAMQRLMEDTLLHSQLAEEGYLHSLQFTTDTVCRQQMALYREMLT